MTKIIYFITETYYEKRPNAYKILDKAGLDLWAVCSLITKKKNPKYLIPELEVAKSFTKYDFYDIADFDGLWSEKFMQCLDGKLSKNVRTIKLLINGVYYYLVKVMPLDFLDRKASKWNAFSDDANAIKSIDKYVFKKNEIPENCIFKLPEGGAFIFCTESIKETLESSNIKGIDFRDAELYGVKPQFMQDWKKS